MKTLIEVTNKERIASLINYTLYNSRNVFFKSSINDFTLFIKNRRGVEVELLKSNDLTFIRYIEKHYNNLYFIYEKDDGKFYLVDTNYLKDIIEKNEKRILELEEKIIEIHGDSFSKTSLYMNIDSELKLKLIKHCQKEKVELEEYISNLIEQNLKLKIKDKL